MNILKLTLNRFYTCELFTLGCLYSNKLNTHYFILELPELNNVKNKSCIPCGEYLVSNHKSPKHGECLEIENVPSRTNILIHKGNLLKDTKGCLLVGKSIGYIGEEVAVLDSKKALIEILDITKDYTNIVLDIIY